MPANKKPASPAHPHDPPPPAAPRPLVPSAVTNAAAAYAGVSIKPPAYDPVAAKAAAEAHRARLAAFPPAELAVPRLDVRAAALAALSVYAFVTQVGPLHARFKAQHEIREFDIANIETLKDAAFLVLYAHAQAEAAGAFKSDAKVPIDLFQQGTNLEARMQELCEYKFKRNPQIAPILAVLSPGTGYRDLATDLIGYADIYEMEPKQVTSDTTNYRPTDVAEARRIAGEILAHLAGAMSPKARDAYDLLQRAWTLLLQVYFEVQTVGVTLMRQDPRRYEWFPSLFAAGRMGRPRKKKGEGDDQEGDGESTGDPGTPPIN
jgi:hypothetical protein